ncbi:MAG: type II secretion system protein [Candidatus Firestonebacteria bacterium]
MKIKNKEIFLKSEKGLTLIEVLIAMAFVALLYAFVVQIFFHGYKNITRGDIQDEGVRLAKNEMVRLSSIENPLYIGLQYKDDGETYINDLKTKKITPYDLVDMGVIKITIKEVLVTETSATEGADEIKKASNERANYVRVVEWQVNDVDPVLVHLWVSVKWTDPQGEFKSDEYVLETMLSP